MIARLLLGMIEDESRTFDLVNNPKVHKIEFGAEIMFAARSGWSGVWVAKEARRRKRVAARSLG